MERFFKTTLKLSLKCIPERLKNEPIFLLLDDTLIEKFGNKFECQNVVFDHTKRNGSSYLNGHAFVNLTISIPILASEKIRYISIPLVYRMKDASNTKLEIASEMIEAALSIIPVEKQVILLCDSWYPKGKVLDTVKKIKNIDIIANFRIDTVLYEFPPAKTGKRGRPPKRGRKINIYEDLEFEKQDKYHFASAKVLTNLFGEEAVHAIVTAKNLENKKSYRLYLSTVMPEDVAIETELHEKEAISKTTIETLMYLPFQIYTGRWSIETIFYEQKTFWGIERYMVRSKTSIESYLNFINVAYSAMLILPILNQDLSFLNNFSAQERKYILSNWLNGELFFASFEAYSETAINSKIP